jgi:hypothetical protein
MAKIVRKRRVHCPIRHVDAFIAEHDDGSFTVKCGNMKTCADSCPYLRDPHYKSPYKRAPGYQPK